MISHAKISRHRGMAQGRMYPGTETEKSTTVHTLICDKVSFAIRISSFQY